MESLSIQEKYRTRKLKTREVQNGPFFVKVVNQTQVLSCTYLSPYFWWRNIHYKQTTFEPLKKGLNHQSQPCCYTSDCFMSFSSKSLFRRSYVPDLFKLDFGGDWGVTGDCSNSVWFRGDVGIEQAGDFRRRTTSGVGSAEVRVGEWLMDLRSKSGDSALLANRHASSSLSIDKRLLAFDSFSNLRSKIWCFSASCLEKAWGVEHD